jgi:crotonobetainyl-CoA:carnitine CoA-transferase CaiB-like acyl-CoA transferase
LLDFKVVEVRAGTGVLGSTICTALPGMLLAEAGAEVTLIAADDGSSQLDAQLGTLTAWDRGKRRVETGPASAGNHHEYLDEVATADLVLYCGPRNNGLFNSLRNLSQSAPWVIVECDDSDLEILVQARTGLTSLMSGPLGGPTFSAIPMAGYGTALAVHAAAYGALLHRTRTGGQAVDFEISMSEGLTATQAMLMRDAERPTVPLGPMPLRNFLYECRNGEWIHLNLLKAASRTSFFQILCELGWTPIGEAIDGNDRTQIDSICSLLRTVRAADLIERLASARIPAQHVVSPSDAFQNPDLSDLGLTGAADPNGLRWLERASLLEPRGRRASSPSAPEQDAQPAVVSLLPLAGINVLDCGAYLAGPYGGFVLSQFGARVVKLEPTSGDAVRALPEIFAMCNAGKESVTVDFSNPSIADTVRALVEWADVVHHNNRSATASRLGLDPVSCFSYNPRLVYSQITAFGSRGPRADQPGFDQTFQAASGSEVLLGGPAGPLWHPSSFSDVAAGWFAAAAILRSLLLREAGVESVHVETPAVAAGLFGVSLIAPSSSIDLALNSELTGWGPGYSLYRCRDERWVAVAVLIPGAWAALAAVVTGMPDEFVPLDRGEVGAQAQSALARCASGLAAHEFEAMVRDAGGRAEVAAGEVRAEPLFCHGESYVDEHVSQLGPGSRMDLWDPHAGRVRVSRTPGSWRIRSTRAEVPKRDSSLPGLGDHSISVLTELGVAPA